MAEIVKVKGIEFPFAGGAKVIPPISLGALEQLQGAIAKFNGDALDASQVATVIDAAHAALKRNYPDITREQVGDMIDVENMGEVFACVMDVSGLKRKADEAGKALGEPGGN